MIYLVIEEKSKLLKPLSELLIDLECSFEIITYSKNVFEVSKKVALLVSAKPKLHRAIIIDDFGIAPFMLAAKVPGIICAMLNDEQSALMTRDHNNANIITLGEEVIGTAVIKGIVRRFVTHEYAGGRHQARVDMLDSMIRGCSNV